MAIETLQEFSKGKRGTVERWLQELELAARYFADWEKSAEKAIDRYEDERAGGGQGFAILQANTETLKGALFQQMPRPVIKPRFRRQDPVARQVAEVIERAILYHNDSPHAEIAADEGVLHALVTGRGVHRIRYEPTVIERRDPVLEQQYLDGNSRYFDAALNELDPEDVQEDDDGPYRLTRALVLERADIELVHWQDFRHAPARQWADVRWVAFRHLMTREQLRKGFGKAKADRVSLGIDVAWGAGGAGADGELPDLYKRAEVWEIWDKERRQVCFISQGLEEEPLGEYGDVYELRSFFPCPEPLRMFKRVGSLEPVPEFRFYQDQAAELDTVTQRINALIHAMRVAGVYDSSYPVLAALAKGGDNKLYPIENFDQLLRQGGIDGVIGWMPLEQMAKAVLVLREHRTDLLAVIREITSIADIQRGQSDPRETASAQQLKAQYSSLRLAPRKRSIARYFRELLELQAELIAERFEPGILQALTGIQLTGDMVTLLKDDTRRNFVIDVETDATIEADEQAEKSQVIELFDAIGRMSSGVQALGLPFEAGRDLILFGLRRFRAGREVEDKIEALEPPQQGPSLADQAKMADAQTRRLSVETQRQEAASRMQLEARKLMLKARELGLKEKELRGRTLLEVSKIVAAAEQARDQRMLTYQRGEL